MKKVLSFLLGFLLAVSGATATLAALLNGGGTSAPLMLSLMRHDAPSSATGLSDEHYPAVTEMIAAYLAGTTADFQYILVDDEGDETPCFNEREQQHMADCRALFVLCREVLLAAATALSAAALGLCALRRPHQAAAGFLAGGGLLLAAAAALFLWAAVDFDGLFVLFHRLSFANDLWLLNPATDLLIRLMPTAFFVHYVALLGITWLAGLLLAEVLAALLLRRMSKQRAR